MAQKTRDGGFIEQLVGEFVQIFEVGVQIVVR
jgi:hypothetical protein